MNNPILSILIVNYNSADFIAVSLESLFRLTKNPFQVFIIDNNSKVEDYNKLKKICSKFNTVYLERKEHNLKGSLAHGTALNELIKKVDTPYFSILDADAIWLKKNWDEILINQITEDIKAIGTQSPPTKAQDFPLMFAVLFETKTFKELNIDFRPEDDVTTQDTGWELSEKFRQAGFKGKNIEQKNTRNYKKGPFKDIICSEYYLDNDYNKIFASHFGRGSNLGNQKYRKGSNIFYKAPFIGKLLRKNKGKKEKKEWLNICKKIINEQ